MRKISPFFFLLGLWKSLESGETHLWACVCGNCWKMCWIVRRFVWQTFHLGNVYCSLNFRRSLSHLNYSLREFSIFVTLRCVWSVSTFLWVRSCIAWRQKGVDCGAFRRSGWAMKIVDRTKGDCG
jgi:hypothetical protein